MPLEKSGVLIKTFGGFQIKFIGKVKVELNNKKDLRLVVFEEVDYKGIPILGFRDC